MQVFGSVCSFSFFLPFDFWPIDKATSNGACPCSRPPHSMPPRLHGVYVTLDEYGRSYTRQEIKTMLLICRILESLSPCSRPCFVLDFHLTFRYTCASAGKSGRCYKKLRTIRAADLAAFDFYGGHKGHFSEAMRMAADPDQGRMAPPAPFPPEWPGTPGEVKG